MAQFTDITITRAGLDMIAKSQAGDNLIFTGLKIGDGQISGQSIPDLTDLISAKKEIPINSVTAKNEGHVEILGIIDNEDISVGFFVREIGIYAKINEGGTPALYGYTNAGNYASYISDASIRWMRLNSKSILSLVTHPIFLSYPIRVSSMLLKRIWMLTTNPLTRILIFARRSPTISRRIMNFRQLIRPWIY